MRAHIARAGPARWKARKWRAARYYGWEYAHTCAPTVPMRHGRLVRGRGGRRARTKLLWSVHGDGPRGQPDDDDERPRQWN